jgi:siroheme synthase
MKGKVYIVGALPGESDFLTVRASEVLREAEVVLHDESVSEEILRLLPPWTQVRNCGQAGMSQEKIHSLLVSAAREGKQVVRLMNVDTMFSRGNPDEMDALREAGVEFEVIPGATSAMSAAAGLSLP